jgi:uncharacterized repeat protein (TIGR01451 family)
MPSEVVLALRNTGTQKSSQKQDALRLKLAGSNPSPRLTGMTELPGTVNYFRGDDPSHWQAGVPTFGRVRVEDAYAGIDVVYYGRQRQLEFDFVIAPGADPRTIVLDFEGSRDLEIDTEGNLLVGLLGGEVRFEPPFAYQLADGERQEVASSYKLLADNRVGFHLEPYDANRELVIDPVLSYSTYFGGTGFDAIHSLAVDAAGNFYLAGQTASADLPVASAVQGTHNGTFEAFVSKISADGQSLIYSTYLGGTGFERANDIAVDASGNAYVTGVTDSADFPVANALQGTFGGGQTDAFVVKLSPAGNALVYSTYLGGSNDENSFDIGGDSGGIAVDAQGNAYVTGATKSLDFPLVNPAQPNFGGGSGPTDVFVSKIDATGATLLNSTYLGGLGFESPHDIAIDAAGSAYVVGRAGNGFPTTTGAFQTIRRSQRDTFAAKLAADGSAWMYATYIGGSSESEVARAVAVDADGNAYIAGETGIGFPTTPGAFHETTNLRDGFVTKLNPDGSDLVYSTLLSPMDESGGNIPTAIALDQFGQAHVTGTTNRGFFLNPVNAVQSACNLGLNDTCRDAYVAVVSADGSSLVMSSYLGGSDIVEETGTGIHVDDGGNIYVAGITTSVDFPTVDPLQPGSAGDREGFVVKISPAIEFGAQEYSAFENDGNATITVRSDGIPGVTTVDYATSDDTALAGPDYLAASGTLTFADRERGEKTFEVPIVDDNDTEGNETVFLTLSNASNGAHLGTANPVTLTIVDDDTDLDVGIGDDPDPITAGEALTYHVSVINRGPGTARNVAVTVNLPAEVSFVSVSSLRMVCTGGSTVTCTMDEMSSLGFASGIITVIPVSAGEISVTASVTHSGFDPDPSNDVWTTTTTVNGTVPTAAAVAPGKADAGAAGFTLLVDGTGYLLDSEVRWNGSPRATTLLNATQLAADIPAGDIANGGTAEITIFNPGLDGGLSNALMIPVTEFSLAASPASASVTAGQATTYTLNVAPVNGDYDLPVSLSCSGLPALSTCSFSPATVTPGAVEVSSTLTIVTTAASSAGITLPGPSIPGLLLLSLAVVTAFFLVGVLRRAPLRRWAAVGALACLPFLISSCGAGSPLDPGSPSTPPGTHSITINGQAGTLSQTTSVTLTVQ